MNLELESLILSSTSSTSLQQLETIQTLWSGYGKIVRYSLKGGAISSVVIKQIQISSSSTEQNNHPRGWNTSISHDRKLKSYEIETNWYELFNKQCDYSCRTPKCYGVTQHEGNVYIVLEDLDESGFPIRKDQVSIPEIKTCLQWLANFHATFMNVKPKDLWPIGTYWHLATRPEELKALKDEKLKDAAPIIDKILNECTYQTIVHGDAKLANFCFSIDSTKGTANVSAVDFQYVGGGCGMKDVAYFLGSCLNDQECETHENELLGYYFTELSAALIDQKSDLKNTIDIQSLEKEWRDLYDFAWTDFHRFLKGWSPGHWKLTSYSERMAQKVIARIDSNLALRDKDEVDSKKQEAKINKGGKLYHVHLQELKSIAVLAAKKAGDYIGMQRSVNHERIIKKGGSSEASKIVTRIDFKSQEIILSHIIPTCKPFNLGLLSEETIDDSSRLIKDYFWCIDPLDGTLPFAEGTDGYAVSIALVSKEGESVLGVVYDPVKNVLYEAIKGLGCWRNSKKWKIKTPSSEANFTFNSNRSFHKLSAYPAVKIGIDGLAKSLGHDTVLERHYAGAVMNAIWTLEEAPGCYVALPKKEAGGGSIWDFAATTCIFTELGLPPINSTGNPLRLNEKETTFMNKQGVIFTSDNSTKDGLLKLIRA